VSAAGAQRKVEKRMRARVREENLVSPTEKKRIAARLLFLYTGRIPKEEYILPANAPKTIKMSWSVKN
jgi:hypothetical protein